jgi:hypothetical protein
MKKLVIFLSLVCLMAYAQRQDIRRGAPLGGVVLIPAGGGAITNVQWENNTTYLLADGTNTVTSWGTTAAATLGQPHLSLVNKSNITIEGMGWNSVLFTQQTGIIARVVHCYNITFRNIRFVGKQLPSVGFNMVPNGQAAHLEIKGTNGFINIENCWFDTGYNFAIAHLSEPRNSTNTTVRNSWFNNFGSTNIGFGAINQDGGCVVAPGSDTVVENCYFANSKCAFEYEGASPTVNDLKVRNIAFRNNVIKNPTMEGIWCAGVVGTDWEGFDFSNNLIDYDKGTVWGGHQDSVGIKVQGGARGIIANNVVRNAPSDGIKLSSAGGNTVEDWVIEGNIITGTGGGGTVNAIGITLDGWEGTMKSIKLQNNIVRRSGSVSIYGSGLKSSQIINNEVNTSSTNAASPYAAILIGTGSLSNIVSGNLVWTDGGVAGVPAYSLEFDATSHGNRAEGNYLRHFTTAAFRDLGTNEFRNNWIGTNLAVRSSIIDANYTTNITGAVSIGTPQSLEITLTSSGANTLANPNIADGLFHNQKVRIRMEGANSVVFTDGQNVELNAATITLSDRDVLFFTYDAADGLWYLDQHMNNL